MASARGAEAMAAAMWVARPLGVLSAVPGALVLTLAALRLGLLTAEDRAAVGRGLARLRRLSARVPPRARGVT